jgi:hypothetical protein
LLATTALILDAFKKDEFILVIIYGPLRMGKSSLAFQILAEVYGTWDVTTLRQYIGFHPEEVLKKWATLGREKQKAFVWDDAGLWLHALDWNSPFVKAAGKYLNVAGTDWGGLILTAPLPTWISKKIRGIPQATTLKVMKVSANPSQLTLRKAVAYRWWMAPDMKHSGVHKMYEESFDVMLPEPFYAWYKPFRNTFNIMAKEIMKEEIRNVPSSIQVVEVA